MQYVAVALYHLIIILQLAYLLIRGLGRSPRKRHNFEHFMPKWSAFWDVVSLIFFNNQIEKI